MKPTTKFMLLLMCSLTLWACKNNNTTTVETPPTEEPSTPVGQLIEGGEEGPYTLYTASTFKASEACGKLEKLMYCEEPKAPAEDSEEIYVAPLVTSLFPLGWSEDGKFAYAQYTETYNEGDLVTYLIQDMTTNDTLWKKEVYYAMATDTAEIYAEILPESVILIKENESMEARFKYAWQLDEKMVLAALEKEGITFNPSTTLLKQSTYEEISFEVGKTPRQEEEFVEYTLNSNKYPARVLYNNYFETKSPEIAGIIKSPYSENIAVISWQKRQLFEMTNEIVPFVIGYQVK